ncbi:MAG: flagellar motor switch phosphatase FliY [Lachnospirales bacterium]
MGDMLTQDEINALLNNNTSQGDSSKISVSEILDKNEVEIFEEIGKETMDVSKDILSRLLNQDVEITSPKLELIKLSQIKNYFASSCVAVKIDYLVGLEGMNILVLSVRDAKVICDLMFGRDGTEINEDEPLNELELSTTGEAMNQMFGSSSTDLAKIMCTKVDIGTPEVNRVDFSDFTVKDFGFDEDIDIFFNMYDLKIGTQIDSNMMQIFPVPFAKKLIGTVVNNGFDFKNGKAVENGVLVKQKSPSSSNQHENIQQNSNVNVATTQNNPMNMQNNYNDNSQGFYQGQGQGQGGMQQMTPRGSNFSNVNARNAEFQDLLYRELEQQKENIDLVMDVPLEITVEMGRTNRTVKEILSFSPGKIIELDKLAGDPIDILVNGKFVAKGEVVVIDENYGIRITDIVNVNNRI